MAARNRRRRCLSAGRGDDVGRSRRASTTSLARFLVASAALHAALAVPVGLLYLSLHRDEPTVDATTISEAELTPEQRAELPALERLPSEAARQPRTSPPVATAVQLLPPVAPELPRPPTLPAPPTPPTRPATAVPRPSARQKMVEQDYEKDDAPAPDARFLAEHSRRVEQETRATDTNLKREQRGEQAASAATPLPGEPSPEQTPGGPKEQLAELRDAPGVAGRRPGAPGPAGARAGQGPLPSPNSAPAGGPGRPSPSPGKLSMRSAVAPGAVVLDRMAPGEGLASPRDSGGGGAVGAAPGGAKGDPRRGPQLQLDYQDYDRIYGQQADRERRLGTDALGDGGGGGREQSSWRKGRWAARQAAMRSALENFIPEVRPGNQTALNTRAYPFARYLTEMHRSIHKLWGFGFLQDLDNKSPANPMNDRKLVTKVEVVLLADGRVDSVSIARSSGNLTFDIAASDVVIAAGPFPAPPEAIRSKNGKVYLHWSFHRDDRQCATSGVEPFILDNPPREKPGALGRSLVPGTFRAQGPVPTPSWPLTWPGKPAPRTLTPFGAGAKEEVAHP